MAYILVFAIIAVILGIKLFSLLGQKKYIRKNQFHNQGRASGFAQEEGALKTIKEVELKLEKVTDPASRLKLLYPSFDSKKFLQEAKNSYKKILKFYANGDTYALSDLINIEMMRKFAYKIAKREEEDLKCDINILKVKDAIVENISFEKDIVAFLRVVFNSEVIHYVSNKKQATISGHKTKIDTRKDVWTFSKNLQSMEPGWKLVEINQLI